jgi:hypothetical protein
MNAPSNATTRPRRIDLDVIPGLSRSRAFFLLAAGISFFLSIGLFFSGDRERGIYVGLWVPSILSCGTLLLGNRRNDE